MAQKLIAVIVGLMLTTGCASQRGGQSVGSPPVPLPSASSPSATPPPSTPPPSTPPPSVPAPAPESACPLCVDPESPKIVAAYAAAIKAAKYPAPDKISRELMPLLRSTEGLTWDAKGRVLMATWTETRFYSDLNKYSQGKPFNLYGDTWLSAVPVVRDFCQALGVDGPMLTLRLEQLFGLPPGAGKDAFLEIWVDPIDIFRPCPDPEISDHECQVEIPLVDHDCDSEQPWACPPKRQVSGKYVTVHPGHLQWMHDNWVSTYSSDNPLENYPWTALGYTYDWGNPDDPRGLSEYVASGGSNVVFESLTPTELYCTSLSDE